MKERALILLMVLAVGRTAAGKVDLVTLPRREKAQLTIYNSADLTLVREQRSLTLKKGLNLLELSWANTLIDPTSLSLEPLGRAGDIEIKRLAFPARVSQVGQWLIDSQISGKVSFEITYFTSGLSWRAFYMGTLSQDEKTMQLKSYVRLANNSGEEYVNAQTRLIVGKVHLLDHIAELARRKHAYGSPVPVPRRRGGAGRDAGEHGAWLEDGVDLGFQAGWGFDAAGMAGLQGMKPKEIRKEGLSEYFLYTIEGTETIAHKWGKRLLSFEVEDIEVESLYKYDEQRWGSQPIRFVKFANDEDHNLGETPIPNGNVKIYSRADDLGHLSYVGGTSVKYIPVDEAVELNLGPARLVEVEPTLMGYKTDNYRFDRWGNIAGWDEIRTWKIEITNTRELPIEIEITRGFGMAYWRLDTDAENVDYKKHDATRARFELSLEPRSKWTFGYSVTTYHGVRQDAAQK